MRRCVVLCAAPVDDYAFLSRAIRDEDYLICADGGMLHAKKISRVPDLLIGDFDSMLFAEFSETEVVRYPPEKDDTDTLLAVNEGLRRGYKDFLLLAATGGRVDHTFANLMLLDHINKSGARGVIRDPKNMLTLVRDSGVSIPPEPGSKFSVFPWGGAARGVTIKSAAYTAENLTMSCDYPIGVSNEFIDAPAEVSVRDGALLLCVSKD